MKRIEPKSEFAKRLEAAQREPKAYLPNMAFRYRLLHSRTGKAIYRERELAINERIARLQ